MTILRLLILASLTVLPACQGQLYFSSHFFEIKNHKVRLEQPLARAVRFVYYYEMSSFKFFAADKQSRAGASTKQFAIPAPTAKASERIAAKAAQLRRSSKSSDRQLAGNLSAISASAARAEQAVGRAAAATDLVLGTTASVIGAMAAVGKKLQQSQAEATVSDIVRETNLIGPSAPAGSVLYVFLYARSKPAKHYSGYRGYVLVSLTLDLGQGRVVRGLELMPFQRRKDSSKPAKTLRKAADGGILVEELKPLYRRGFPHDQMVVLARPAVQKLAAAAKSVAQAASSQ